ncbi:zinc finger BED domain-containing protein DAYSLEEPER-like [Pyrus communis]|uniref:zinc finger BED domain-containing protein DAYSLEEPER-like n=1 Tax=Pyrus communis TaxID=23211 RepID=UPI0035C02224
MRVGLYLLHCGVALSPTPLPSPSSNGVRRALELRSSLIGPQSGDWTRRMGSSAWRTLDQHFISSVLSPYEWVREFSGGSSTTIVALLEDVELNEEFIIQACGGDENKIEMMKELIQERSEQRLLEISNEIDKYFTAPYIIIIVGAFDLLSWWKSNTKEFPILSQIVKDIFAIPTSTIASKNAFSLGRRVVDPFRTSFTPKMVDALVCTSD